MSSCLLFLLLALQSYKVKALCPSSICRRQLQRKQPSTTRKYNSIPTSQQQHSTSAAILGLRLAFAATTSLLLPLIGDKACAAENLMLLYLDSQEKFSINLPSGFINVPRRGSQSKGSTGAAQPVEILLTANDFTSQAAISVGKTYVPQLLEDFSVPWAKRPISNIEDVGTARIVAELLILQRQGAFGSEWFKTKLGVTNLGEAATTNMDNNISEILSCSLDKTGNSATFDFETPVSAGIRYTTATSRLNGNYLFTTWISAIDSTWKNPDFRQKLIDARESFVLV